MATSDGLMGYVVGRGGDDDIRRVIGDADGSMLRGNAGDDVLRGGWHDDILIGGAGDDRYWGGYGADQFRFLGNEIGGASDFDRIYDLKFAEGDKLVFGNYAAGTFVDGDGLNGFNGGAAAVITSWDGVVDAAAGSSLVTASRYSANTDTLLLTLVNGDTGQTQQIVITGGWSQYVAAGGTDGL
jgi:Ca2+-binding RTX toxin-like protein